MALLSDWVVPLHLWVDSHTRHLSKTPDIIKAARARGVPVSLTTEAHVASLANHPTMSQGVVVQVRANNVLDFVPAAGVVVLRPRATGETEQVEEKAEVEVGGAEESNTEPHPGVLCEGVHAVLARCSGGLTVDSLARANLVFLALAGVVLPQNLGMVLRSLAAATARSDAAGALPMSPGVAPVFGGVIMQKKGSPSPSHPFVMRGSCGAALKASSRITYIKIARASHINYTPLILFAQAHFIIHIESLSRTHTHTHTHRPTSSSVTPCSNASMNLLMRVC